MSCKWKNLTFKTQKEAQEARRALWRLLDEQESVTLYDICKVCNKSGHKDVDMRYVWYDFGSLYVIKQEDKWRVVIQAEPFYKDVVI